VRKLDPIFKALAPKGGYLHCGPTGAGHFVKMVHNGVEYGVMAAYAEGFNLLAAAPGYSMDTAKIAELWRHGSVVRSWLLDLTASALAKDPRLAKYEGRVSDSGEGRWTVQTAVDAGVPTPVLSAALFSRFASRGEDDFANKLLSAMRAEFGGHSE
jgi:6-phosphogluconate dehydrogenase